MGRDRQNGHARPVTVKKPVDEVQIARPAASRADRERLAEMRVSARCEGRNFLVTDVHLFDLSLLANGVGQPVQAVSDDTVDALHTGCREGCRQTGPQQLSCLSSFVGMPLSSL